MEEKFEEFHNGRVCVVERVRDKYLLPEIRQFEKLIELKRKQ